MKHILKTLCIASTLGVISLILATGGILLSQTTQPQRDNVYMRVLAVNPSKEKSQTVNIKEFLPQEVTPKDIISTGGLDLEYDTEKGLYYVYKENIELPTAKTTVFTIELKNIWYITEEKLNILKVQAESIVNSTKNTENYSTAKDILEEINKQFEEIATSQKEAEALPFKQQIATYRNNMDILKRIQENIEKMRILGLGNEKSGSGSPEQSTSKLKSGIPSKSATWMVIFIIMTFLLVLGAAFFFAWIRSNRSIEKTTSETAELSFSEPEPQNKEETTKEETEEK